MKKIDKRIAYKLIVDTETANTTDEPLFYDFGAAVIDNKGRVYETASFINKDVFFKMKDLMQSAYYANKLPRYYKDIKEGKRQVKSLYEIRKYICDLCKEYDIKVVMAHNARFDDKAMKLTQRYITKSKYRWFLPYGIEIWDTQKMAHDTICKQKGYIDFCKRNGYMTKHRTPRPQEKAEVIYRYISGNNDFVESHTGLEDVMIEKEIFAHCMRQHKAMRKRLYK